MVSLILHLYVSISDVSGQIDILTRRNVKKPLIFPAYRGKVESYSAGLAFVGSKDITPTQNLRILHKEGSVLENSLDIFRGITIFRGGTYLAQSKSFLLTDVVADYISPAPVPLFWKHQLPSASINPDSISLVDSEYNEVDENSYRAIRISEIDENTGLVVPGSYEECSLFTNCKNSYNEETGEINLYYVRFEVYGQSYFELLSPQPAFSLAGIDDVSEITGSLKWWRKKYVVSSDLEITAPGVGTYYLTYQDEARISLVPYGKKDDTLPWFAGVTNGSFSRAIHGGFFNYDIPEFPLQDFVPIYPYKRSVDLVQQISPGILYLPLTHLRVEETSLFPLEIVIRDKDLNPLYALTTTTSKAGESYYEGGIRATRPSGQTREYITWNTQGILGVDALNGFVLLRDQYPLSYYFETSYLYEEQTFEITTVNLNPIFGDGSTDDFHVVYIIPRGGDNIGTTDRTGSVHYLRVDSSGRILGFSQDGSDGNLNLSSFVGNNPFFYSWSASSKVLGEGIIGDSTLTLDKSLFSLREDGEVDLPGRGAFLIGSHVGVEDSILGTESFLLYYSSFIGTITEVILTLSSPLTQIIPDETPVKLLSFKDLFSTEGVNNLQYLVLGEVDFSCDTRIEDLSVLDVRRNGGYIKEEYLLESVRKDPRAFWASEFASPGVGQPVPGYSAAVVKIPFTILQDYGGSFTLEQIESIVTTRHLASGILPTIVLTGAIPVILSLVATSTTITVCWASEGPGYTYNVYLSSSPEGSWAEVYEGSSGVPYGSSGYSSGYYSGYSDSGYYGSSYYNSSCFTITSLFPGVVYYVAVSSISSNEVESPKSMVWGIKTRSS